MSNAEPQGLSAYYAAPAVRRRILEYCGGTADAAPTAVYVAGVDPSHHGAGARWEAGTRVPASNIEELFERGADIARSLWDRESLIVHLDLDYQNTDFEGEAFSHPAEAFFRLEPVYRAVRHECDWFDLPLFCLMTGRGYHFTGGIALDSPLIARLGALAGRTPEWHATLASRRPAGCDVLMTEEQAWAHAGVGQLVEYLAHRVLRRAERRAAVPVVFNGTVVGPGVAGRAAASIDFSYLGDPLDSRHIRVAFGGYQTHRLRDDLVGTRVARGVRPLAAVPRGRRGPLEMLPLREPARAARLAANARTSLPEVHQGVARMMAAYSTSRLAAFHRSFNAAVPAARERRRAPPTFDPSGLAPCIAWPLRQPNDLLLKPAFVQHVTRGLMADGWDPADIATLVHDRYVSDAGWGDRWQLRDPWTRAEFDVRVFAGLVRAGLDDAIDFNCVSAQEKGLCPGTGCRLNLLDTRQRLLERA